jgi:hypothetical protein
MKQFLSPLFILLLIVSFNGCGEDNGIYEYYPPDPPALVSPPNGSIDSVSVHQFTWNSSGGASLYRIQISLDSAFTQLLADTSMAATVYDFEASLQPSTIYYWKVCAINNYGQGGYSAIWSFHTSPSIVTQSIQGSWVLIYSAGTLDICPGEEVTFPGGLSGTAQLKCPNQPAIFRDYTVTAGVLKYTASGVQYQISFTTDGLLALTGINNSRILYYLMLPPGSVENTIEESRGWNSSE